MIFICDLIGIIFCTSSAFKFYDFVGFIKEFRQYDIIAKRFPVYAYLFPCIELVLGLAFLNYIMPFTTNIIAFVILSLSLIGILRGMRVTTTQ